MKTVNNVFIIHLSSLIDVHAEPLSVAMFTSEVANLTYAQICDEQPALQKNVFL